MIRITNPPIELRTIRFSGGELQPRLQDPPQLQSDTSITIHADLWSSDDIIELALVVNALDEQYPAGDIEFDLVCPYLPYARQDRVCAKGEAFALKVIADLIESMSFASVTVWDVHSPVAHRQIGSLINRPAADFVQHIPNAKDYVLVSPDKGAFNRVVECAQRLETRMICADKTRDPNSGNLGPARISQEHIDSLPPNPDFLIVDDICDGGRTFVNLAQVLKPLTNGNIYLYVTHGIFAAGFEALAKYIDHIYVANLHPHVRIVGMDYLVTHLGDNQ